MFGARHVRQEALLDAVELDVQSGRIPEIEFRGRLRAACATSASVGGGSYTRKTTPVESCTAHGTRTLAVMRMGMCSWTQTMPVSLFVVVRLGTWSMHVHSSLAFRVVSRASNGQAALGT